MKMSFTNSIQQHKRVSTNIVSNSQFSVVALKRRSVPIALCGHELSRGSMLVNDNCSDSANFISVGCSSLDNCYSNRSHRMICKVPILRPSASCTKAWSQNVH
jgi:hypothetical protein